jgi:predicted transcriptional regulator
MKKVLFVFLLFLSAHAVALDSRTIDSKQVHSLYQFYQPLVMPTAIDLIDKQEKVNYCVTDYKKRRAKKGANTVRDILFGMISNFEQTISGINANRQNKNIVANEKKLQALALMQCEIFYSMGVLE